MTPLTEKEKHTIQTFYQAFNDKNPDLLNQICAEDWEDIPLGPDQAEGPEGFKEIIRTMTELFPDIRIEVHEIIGSGHRAGVRASMIFTHSSAFMGVEPTHKKVNVALHEFHHLKDGKLIKTWHLEDWFGFLKQTDNRPAAS